MTKRRAGSRTPGSLSRESNSRESVPGVCQFWLPTTKSRESTRNTWLQTTCDISLESSRRELQLCFRLHSDLRSSRKVMGLQSPGSLAGRDFGTPGKKSHLDVVSAERRREYYKGEGGGFPESGPWWVLWEKGSKVVAYSQARGVVCQSESEFTRGCPNSKRTQNEF